MIKPAAAALLFVVLPLSLGHAENWPQWRGPDGTGVSHETGELPVTWNDKQGIVWHTELPEWGDSAAAIWGDAIFLTSHHDDNLLLIKLDKKSGRIEWTQTVGAGSVKRAPIQAKSAEERREQKFHNLHNLASPTPATDGKHVVAHFGNGDLACYDYAGHQLWKHNLQDEYGTYTIWWGHANSPIIVGTSVISVCMQDSLADVAKPPIESYLVAHDVVTGKVRWKTPRATKANAEECDAYTTPLLTTVDGKQQLIVMGGNQLDAYDPATGKQLWFLPGITGGRTVCGPTIGEGLVYVTQGKGGPLLAVKLDGPTGERPKGDIAWRYDQGTPDSSTPVVWENHLFTINDGGVARGFNATTGHLEFTQRLKGDFKPSPVAAQGRIYFLNTHGLCTVLTADKRGEKLAENQIDDETIASPAISDGHIFLRGRKALYCIGKPF